VPLFTWLLAVSAPSRAADPTISAVVLRDPEINVVVGSLDEVPDADDVTLGIEDGYAEVTDVRRLVDSPLPVATAILVDTSLSMRSSFDDVRSALHGFVDGMAGGDVVLVISFDEVVVGADGEWQGPDQAAAIDASIDSLVADGQHTHLYEALNAAVDRLTVDQGDFPLRPVLVLSDGEDDGSPASRGLERARVNAVRHEVAINAVGYTTGTSDATGVLRDLALDTRGRYRFASDARAIEGMFADIQQTVHDLVVVRGTAETIPAGSYELSVRIGEGDEATEATRRLDLDQRFVGEDLEGNDEPDYTVVHLAGGAGAAVLLIGTLALLGQARRRRELALQGRVREAEETARRVAAEAAAVRPTRCDLSFAEGRVAVFSFGEFGERVIGSDPDRVEIPLDKDTVSGAHARLARRADDPEALYVTDLGSRNGTYHQGLDVRSRGTVRVGNRERLQFGLFATQVDFMES